MPSVRLLRYLSGHIPCSYNKSKDFAQSYISEGQGLNSVGNVSPDGRISIHLDLEKGTPDMHNDHAHDVEEFAVDKNEWNACPQMNIVIMIVGSRGAFAAL